MYHTTVEPCRVLLLLRKQRSNRKNPPNQPFFYYTSDFTSIIMSSSVSKLLHHFRNSRKGQKRQMNETASLPPQYKADPQLQRKLRFNFPPSTGNVTLLVTRFSLFSTYGYATSSTNAVSAYGSIKINRVQVWTIPANSSFVSGSSNLNFASFTWLSETSPNVELSSAGNQFSPGYITTRPPDHSLAGYWTSKVNVGTAGPTTSANLFTIAVPIGVQVVVDIECVYVPCSRGEEVPFNPAGVSAAGFTYQPLDNGGALLPVSNVA